MALNRGRNKRKYGHFCFYLYSVPSGLVPTSSPKLLIILSTVSSFSQEASQLDWLCYFCLLKHRIPSLDRANVKNCLNFFTFCHHSVSFFSGIFSAGEELNLSESFRNLFASSSSNTSLHYALSLCSLDHFLMSIANMN